jgi:hypothetical protein
MKQRAIGVLLAAAMAFTAGCSFFNTKMDKVTLGMTQDQVKQSIGTPKNVVEAQQLDNQKIEVWEYPAKGDAKYWIYFVNGKVDSWRRVY